VNLARAGVIRASGTLGIRLSPHSGRELDGAPGLGFALAALDKRGAEAEVLRLDRLRYWAEGRLDVAFSAVDVGAEMLGTDVDHNLCAAALPIVALGDCQHGGAFGLRAELFHHAYESTGHRWLNRWLELGTVWNLWGNSFDVDFVKHRLPILIGASLDHAAGAKLPAGEESVHLRGAAGVDAAFRFAGFRAELLGSLRYRPSLAPFDAVHDYALEGNVRLAYIWLAALFGAVRPTAQRLYLDVRATHWEKPWFSDRTALARNVIEATLGLELTLRNVTPN
jgi:hypothetical protein